MQDHDLATTGFRADNWWSTVQPAKTWRRPDLALSREFPSKGQAEYRFLQHNLKEDVEGGGTSVGQSLNDRTDSYVT